MWVWRNARERWLLAATITAFALVCLVNLRLPLWKELDGSAAASFLGADATVSVTSDLLVGLISAYIFYVIIELLPSHRRQAETLRVLNLLVAFVVDAFDKTKILSHDSSIHSIDLNVLKISSLESNLAILANNPDIFRMKLAMDAGHSRYRDFQHALSLAVGLSPEHALDWLVLTDKIRLLAQEFGTYPVDPLGGMVLSEPPENNPSNYKLLKDMENYRQDAAKFKSTLQFRLIEVFDASLNWMLRQKGV